MVVGGFVWVKGSCHEWLVARERTHSYPCSLFSANLQGDDVADFNETEEVAIAEIPRAGLVKMEPRDEGIDRVSYWSNEAIHVATHLGKEVENNDCLNAKKSTPFRTMT